jgi:hypothetical protein
MSQLADQLKRAIQRKDAVEAMVTDVKATFAEGTDLLLDGQHDPGERGYSPANGSA